MAEIELDHVVKRYPDGALAVQDFNLTIADKEFIILVGPSGCGKSTTLNMVAGLEDITQGELRIDGKVMNTVAPKDRDIAMVFQSYALYPHMTVAENMGFPLRLAKVDKATIRQKVEEAAEMLELTQHLDRKPSNLSGGQRQRVAMGRAIVRSPKAFLMDEPLSNLDAKLRVQMRTQVSRIQKTLGTTTLYVTHDQTEAMTLGDRVVVMRAGIIQQVGAPQELYDAPKNIFVAGFIGSPSMNFLPAQINGGQVTTALGTVDLPDELRRAVESRGGGGEVIIGIRPEHFEIGRLKEGVPGGRFNATFDIVESMGSDIFAYFTLSGSGAKSKELEELAADTGQESLGGDGIQVGVRLDPEARVSDGSTAELWYDTSKLHIFDLKSGENLTHEVAKASSAASTVDGPGARNASAAAASAAVGDGGADTAGADPLRKD
ncbi:ABC transporter ATP-binding protein [Nakamurella aerolata]|uniref:sn-glycerol-3-phosphate ABC transporter ATP-binding protein UgpC n=1 Tax=Nakamurella aerolata TaxID=1656892 RepID=A0A849ABT8_9ACTN|nr:sn-glycerol-3-phosphate ABC transporter ATP-binding protein UgpC [Nakamurella aerolata]NNG34362.1 sn-glycerol-3-phosphate ABC transporter ATP-binding protein UgpC [Nakamurella aerolata]